MQAVQNSKDPQERMTNYDKDRDKNNIVLLCQNNQRSTKP